MFNAFAVAVAGVLGFEIGQSERDKEGGNGEVKRPSSRSVIPRQLTQGLEGLQKGIEKAGPEVKSELFKHVAIPVVHDVEKATKDVSQGLKVAKKDFYQHVAIPVVRDVQTATKDVGEGLTDVKRFFTHFRW